MIRLNRLHYPVTALGPGTRVGIWVQGCSIGCAGCVSRDTWDPFGSQPMPVTSVPARLDQLVGEAGAARVDGVTISGGEPFDQASALAEMLLSVRAWLDDRGGADADILSYSGYELTELNERGQAALDVLDGVIVGPYRAGEPTDVPWCGSANQRLVALSERGAVRYAEWSDRRHAQIDIDADGRVWIIGVPARGVLAKVERRLADAGIRLEGVSWRP